MKLRKSEVNGAEKLKRRFLDHPLLLTCQSAFHHYMADMSQYDFTSEDLFLVASEVIDTIFEEPASAPQYLEGLWDNVKIALKKYNSVPPPQEDLNTVCKVLFYVVAATLSLHWKAYYNTELVSLLFQAVDDKRAFDGTEEQRRIISNLCKHSEGLEEWINEYEDSRDWLTDEIEACLRDNQAMEPKRKLNSKPEKQHGVEYPVFSKGSGVTDDHIVALYRLLTTRGWISTQTCLVDFKRLFSGKSNECEIIWTGQDKLGSNEPTSLGVSALYVLFKKMADEGLINTGSKANRVGPILEMHFVDTEGHYLTSVSNARKTSEKANAYIERILQTMRMRPSSEDIQRLLAEEMESRYDKNDRQDLNYRRRH